MYTIYAATDRGIVREYNEDRFTARMITDRFGYALVCDGMGGENGGGVASALACSVVARVLDGSYREGLDENSVYMIMETALANANTAVYERARSDDDALGGMGTTASLAVLLGNVCYIANVGDSRVYLLRDGQISQLTVDHTHVQLMVERGEITQDEARQHPKRHYLTRAIGVEASVLPYYCQLELEPEDILLLCSDGLHGLVEPHMLANLMTGCPPEALCQLLIDEANKLGGYDNITAALIVTCGGAANG